MSTFIRGPVCGTDNCPSRLWRIIDGRRTCRYGHVMDGDIEFNNDEDDVGGNAMAGVASSGVVTRRLNLTTNAVGGFQASLDPSQIGQMDKLRQQKDKKRKLSGVEADRMFLRCIQYTLRKQCRMLITKKSFPESFESTVKLIWIRLLQDIDQKNSYDLRAHAPEDGSESDNEPIEDQGRSKNRLHADREPRHQPLGIHMLTTISILYLASYLMGLPVYTNDFIRWICNQDIPYFHTSRHLPHNFKSRLPGYYFMLLDGSKPPRKGAYFAQISAVAAKVRFSTLCKDSLFLEGLLLKTTLQLTIPPIIYLKVNYLINAIDPERESFHLPESERFLKKRRQINTMPEYRLLAYLIITLRYELLLNSDNYSESYVRSLIEQPYPDIDPSGKTVQNQISNVSYGRINIENITRWSKDETMDYLDFIENKLVHGNDELSQQSPFSDLTIDQKIAKRQLFKLFPIKDSIDSKMERRKLQSFSDELQEKYLKQFSMHSVYYEQNTSEYVKLVSVLEDRLITILAEDFAVTKRQFELCVKRIEHQIKRASI